MQVEIAHSYVAGITNSSVPTKMTAAARALESIREQASQLGYFGLELESRLRLGELQLRSGRSQSGHARLAQLQKDAEETGFLLIARRAKSASLAQTSAVKRTQSALH